jgi:hypothetical protein
MSNENVHPAFKDLLDSVSCGKPVPTLIESSNKIADMAESVLNQKQVLLDGYIQLLKILRSDLPFVAFKDAVRETITETLEKHNAI